MTTLSVSDIGASRRQGKFGADARTGTHLTLDGQPPVQRLDAIANVGEPTGARAVGHESSTAVVHGQAQQVVKARQPYPGAVGAGVLGHIGQRFAGDEVSRALHVLREPLSTQTVVRNDLHGDRKSGDPGLQRRNETVVAQHRRVDAVGKLPEVPEHLSGLSLKLSQLFGGELVTAEPVAGEPEAGDKRHHLLLDPVMQVALNATPLRVLGSNETYPRRRQLLEPLLELSRKPNVGNCRRSLRGDGSQQFKISGSIATWLGAKIDSPDQLACADEVDAGCALVGYFTCHAYGFVEPAAIRFTQPDPHPARTDSVPDGAGESRQQLVELGRLLHCRAEVPQ